MTKTKPKLKLTARQKKAMKLIAESGEMVVIEDGWIIYTAESRRMVFGYSSSSEHIEVMDVDIVQGLMVRATPAKEDEYRDHRRMLSNTHTQHAKDLLDSDRLEEAKQELYLAIDERLSPSKSIELYRMES